MFFIVFFEAKIPRIFPEKKTTQAIYVALMPMAVALEENFRANLGLPLLQTIPIHGTGIFTYIFGWVFMVFMSVNIRVPIGCCCRIVGFLFEIGL